MQQQPDMDRIWRVRLEVLKLFKHKNLSPDEGLVLCTMLVGQLAVSQGVGLFRMLRGCWTAYFDEKKRLLQVKLLEQ